MHLGAVCRFYRSRKGPLCHFLNPRLNEKAKGCASKLHTHGIAKVFAYCLKSIRESCKKVTRNKRILNNFCNIVAVIIGDVVGYGE